MRSSRSSLEATAQEPAFPQRGPLEITVLFPAGSSADVTARMLADGMARQLGQRVLVVNRPGAGGAIGYKHVAAQKPDGYSLVWNSNSISTTYHSGQLDFDYQRLRRGGARAGGVAGGGGARRCALEDAEGLIADAKARPKQISVGHSGVGSHTHISLVALPALPASMSTRCRSARRRWCRASSADTSMRWCSCPRRSPAR